MDGERNISLKTGNDSQAFSDERTMTLFWWWSIDQVNGFQSAWRDNLTPEEQALVEKWDADISEEVEKGN